MPNVFLSKQLEVNQIGQTVYTVPPTFTTVVIGFFIGNKTDADVSVAADLVRGATKTRIIGNSTPIPAGSSLRGLGGEKLVMQADDYVTVEGSADACADVTLSIMEIQP